MEPNNIEFSVPGKPKSAQQLQFNRKTGSVYRTKEYKARVNEIAFNASEWLLKHDVKGPAFGAHAILSLSIEFRFPFTTEHYHMENGQKVLKDKPPFWYTKKVDIDNMLKSTKDAMSGIIYADDGQVVQYANMRKFYSIKPEMLIFIERFDSEYH